MNTPRSVPVGSVENPIRIMRIIARLNIGGPAIHVSLLAAGMNDNGYASQLVTGHIGPGEGDMSYLAADNGVSPVFVDGLGRDISAVDDLRAFISLVRLISREKPHVVHTHTAKAGFLGRFAAWYCRVPVIVHTFHGHAFHGYFGPLKTRLFILLEQLAGRMSSVILTISDRLRDELVNFRIAPADHIKVIPLGLDLDWLADLDSVKGKLRGELKIAADTPLIGIVGRLVPIKNHTLFLSAAKKIVDQNPAARFVIVGDGELRAELEAKVRELGLGANLDFLGWQHNLDWIYADLDVLALTSDNEGTPVSIIEAMAGRVPVVATSVGGVPDLLQDGVFGRMAQVGDADSVAAAILGCLHTGRDIAQLEKAQQYALQCYSSGRLVTDLKDLYQSLLVQAGIQVKEN